MKAYSSRARVPNSPEWEKIYLTPFQKRKKLFATANSILGFPISDDHVYGFCEELKQTQSYNSPASLFTPVLTAMCKSDSSPDMVAGHSLGEFSSLVSQPGIVI